jgi:MoaA/NifB/PqqE/SkfB family radical SAM enzyme
LDKLIAYGIKKITFTGGEASLYRDLWKLIQYAHDHKIYTNLVTNAVSFNDDFISNIEKHLNCITVSLDGPNPVIQEKMTRNCYHFGNVLNFLEKIEQTGMVIEKKINTLVSKINIDYITDIFPILYKYGINIWKLFQFISPRYQAELNESLFSVSDFDFIAMRKKVIAENKKENLKIIFQSKENLKKSYFVVSSNGDVRYDGGKKGISIGNILHKDINHIFDGIDFNYNDYMDRRINEPPRPEG